MNKEFQKALKESKTTSDLRAALKKLPLPSDSITGQPMTLNDLISDIETGKVLDEADKFPLNADDFDY